MKITVDIDEKELQKCITDIMASKLASGHFSEENTIKKKVIESAIKEVIYSQKEELIEKCVSRASTELVKKAMPKLLEKITINE